MKQVLFTLLLIFSLSAKSQSYIITMLDTLKYGNCGDLLLPTVTFSNTSSGDITMHMNRILKNIPSGWTSCFCAPTCLAQTQSQYDFTITAGGSKSSPAYQDVSPNFGSDSIPGTGEVIVVFNQVGFTNYDTIMFRGITSKLSGIKEFEKLPFQMVPNPVSDVVYLKNLEKPIKSIDMMDATGRIVLNKITGAFDGQIKINVNALTSGQYIMIVYCDDNTVYRKKFIKS